MCPDGSVSQAWTGEDDKRVMNSSHPWLFGLLHYVKCSAEYRKGECRLFVAVQIHLALENVYKLHNLYN